VRSFRNRGAIIRLVGAVLAVEHDEWMVARRHLGGKSLRTAQAVVSDQDVRLESPQARSLGNMVTLRTPSDRMPPKADLPFSLPGSGRLTNLEVLRSHVVQAGLRVR